MNTSHAGRSQSGRDARARRYPCAFCEQPDMWPDLCSEAPDAVDSRCAETIAAFCMRGDHRRCAPSACVVAARWQKEVSDAGMAAAQAAGTVWAVVSTIHNRVDVVGTENHLGRARSILRGNAVRHSGRAPAEVEGMVYVVCGRDGGSF